MALIAALVASAAIAAAGTAYGASQTSGALNNQGDVAAQQARLAEQLFGTGANARKYTLSDLESFLTGGEIPFPVAPQSPNLYGLDNFLQTGQLPTAVAPGDTTAASRDTLERQFQRARESTINQAPNQGGYLASGLTDLEAQRALGITGITSAKTAAENNLRQQLYGVGLDISRESAQRENQLRQGLFSQALGAGFNTVAPALTSLAGAGNTYGNIASTTLKGTQGLGDVLGTTVGFGLPAILRQQRGAGTSLQQALAGSGYQNYATNDSYLAGGGF